MAPLLAGEDVLRRLFAGAAEQTFEAELGVADPPLVEYLVELLLRFLRQESIYRVRDDAGHRLRGVPRGARTRGDLRHRFGGDPRGRIARDTARLDAVGDRAGRGHGQYAVGRTR